MARLILGDIDMSLDTIEYIKNYEKFTKTHDNIHKIFEHIQNNVDLINYTDRIYHRKKYVKIYIKQTNKILFYFTTNKKDISKINFIMEDKIQRTINKDDIEIMEKDDKIFYKLNMDYGIFPFYYGYNIKIYFESDIQENTDTIEFYCRNLDIELYVIYNLWSICDVDTKKLLDIQDKKYYEAEDDFSDNQEDNQEEIEEDNN